MSRFRPTISDRVPSGTHYAELYLSPGPEHIGVTGDNSYAVMYGFDWLLVWDRDDGLLHLWQERDGAWVEVTTDLPPVFASPAPVGSRRWSLAFDQSARVILAYEDATGVVRVTRWEPSSNSYVQNVTFSGCDPCVVIDASWSFSIPGSDVLLFYLSTDRTKVMCRVQRDVYGVEYEVWDYGQPVILDRVIATPLRYQVLVSDPTGTPLPEMLLSALYPYLSVDVAVGAAALPIIAGKLQRVALQATVVDTASAGATATATGSYDDPIITYTSTETAAGAAATGATGAYRLPILDYEALDNLDGSAAAGTTADYALVVMTPNLSADETLGGASTSVEGIYA